MHGYFFDFVNILGGLALFLFGVEQCSVFFRGNLTSGARDAMMRFTKRASHSFALGVGLSAVTQSSTIATSFAVGFVDAGMMSFSGALAVMMGASLGGTFVSFLLGLNLFVYAPLMFGASFFLSRLKDRRLALAFGLLRCLSLIFLGMLVLGFGTKPLFADPAFRGIALEWASDAWVMAAFAFLCAGVLQSSSAVMALGLALCAADALPPLSALALALGAHAGSTTMVVLAGMNAGLSARRLAFATFAFKTVGSAAFALCIPIAHAAFAHLGAAPARELVFGQVAIAVFNIALFLPFRSALVSVSERLVSGGEDLGEPRYLNEELLGVHELAVTLLSREISRLAAFMEAYLQMLLEPTQRDEKLFRALPKAISDLCDACQEFTYRLHVPLNDERLRSSLIMTSYAMSNIRGMTRLLCGEIRYDLEAPEFHDAMTDRLGAGLWLTWKKLSRKCLRDSFRAFVIGEQGLVSSVRELENEILLLSARIRRELAWQDQGYDRSAARAVRLVSAMQGFLSTAKELAEGESFVKKTLRESEARRSGKAYSREVQDVR